MSLHVDPPKLVRIVQLINNETTPRTHIGRIGNHDSKFLRQPWSIHFTPKDVIEFEKWCGGHDTINPMTLALQLYIMVIRICVRLGNQLIHTPRMKCRDIVIGANMLLHDGNTLKIRCEEFMAKASHRIPQQHYDFRIGFRPQLVRHIT